MTTLSLKEAADLMHTTPGTALHTSGTTQKSRPGR